MSLYLIIKKLHMYIALTSGSFFILRWMLLMFNLKCANNKYIRYASYLIDSLLLSLAIYLIYILPKTYFNNGWIYLKILLVINYIILGSFAIKRAKTKINKIICFILAILIFSQIYFIAKFKHPLGIFLYIIYWLN